MMTPLQKKLVRLIYKNPELKESLLPLLKESLEEEALVEEMGVELSDEKLASLLEEARSKVVMSQKDYEEHLGSILYRGARFEEYLFKNEEGQKGYEFKFLTEKQSDETHPPRLFFTVFMAPDGTYETESGYINSAAQKKVSTFRKGLSLEEALNKVSLFDWVLSMDPYFLKAHVRPLHHRASLEEQFQTFVHENPEIGTLFEKSPQKLSALSLKEAKLRHLLSLAPEDSWETVKSPKHAALLLNKRMGGSQPAQDLLRELPEQPLFLEMLQFLR